MGEADDFSPRPYQEQLMNLVKKQNTIIYLPTGSGKTYIAVMLIKEMSASLDRWVISFQLRSGSFWVNKFYMLLCVLLQGQAHLLHGEHSGTGRSAG